MKNVYFATLVAVAISSTAVAQETSKGFNNAENSLEIGFNPFSNNYQTFRIDELKYRRFFGQNALRVRLGFEIGSDSQTKTTNTGENPVIDALNPSPGGTTSTGNKDIKTTDNTTKFNIYVGYERHFNVSNNIALYAGAEIGYELESGSQKVETNETSNKQILNYHSGTSAYDNTTIDFVSSKVDETKKRNSYGAFAANILTGVDVNIYKGLYLGAELRLGMTSTSYKTPEFTSTFNSTETKVESEYGTANPTMTTTQTIRSSVTDADGNKTVNTLVTKNGVPTTDQTTISKNYNDQTTDKSKFNLKLYASPALRIGIRF